MYNFESLDILWAWIGHPCEKLWPFVFLESFHCSSSSVSLYHGPHTYTRVKSHGCLNFQTTSMYNFESLDILWAWIGHPSEMLWRFEFLETLRCSFSSCSIFYGPHTYSRVKSYGHLNFPGPDVFNYNGLDILCAWINIRVTWYNHLNFTRASVVQFRASRWVMSPNRTSVLRVMTIQISRELRLFNLERLDILCTRIGHPSEKL